MALMKLTEVKVKQHIGTNGAFSVEEWIHLPDGRSFPKTFTVWANEAPEIGTIVNVIGSFSAKAREYAAPSGQKIAIDVSINEPEVTIVSTAQAETPKESAPF